MLLNAHKKHQIKLLLKPQYKTVKSEIVNFLDKTEGVTNVSGS